MKRGFGVIAAIIIIVVLLIVGGIYYVRVKRTQNQIITITIMVPENISAYKSTDFVDNPPDLLKNWPFVKKQLNIPYTNDIVRASAEAAAEQIEPSGGPSKATVSYLKIQNDVAYVELNIDLDGWPGVSYSKAKIHPLVEKTLLQFPEIKKVIFDFAPGDSRDSRN